MGKKIIVEYRRKGKGSSFASTEAASNVRAPKSDKIHKHLHSDDKGGGLKHNPFEKLGKGDPSL